MIPDVPAADRVLAAVRSIPHPRQEPTMTAPRPSPAGLSPLLDQLDEARAGENLALPWHVDPYDGQRIATSLGGGVCSTYLPGDAALIVAAVNALPELIADLRKRDAAIRAVLAEHQPMANSPGCVPACPDCLGGIYADDPDEARSCGCFGLLTPVCSSCADRDGARLHPVQWPCPTVQAITAALTPGADTAGATA